MKPSILLITAFALLATGNILRAQATDQPVNVVYFDTTKGFLPAQNDLTAIFLQIGGSLETTGSPISYLRHIFTENERVQAKYRQNFGHDPVNYCPAYMTRDYLDQLEKNWNLLSPKLGLETLAKEDGRFMIYAIKGTKGTGTPVIEVFNAFQARVFDGMAGKTPLVGCDDLQAQLWIALELDDQGKAIHAAEIARKVALEIALTDSQKAVYSSFLQKDYFTKDDFTPMDVFYKNGYDKLTEQGKNEMSVRIWNGTRGGSPRSDALQYAAAMSDKTQKLLARLDAALKPDDSIKIKTVVTSIMRDVVRMGQSELEIAIAERALKQQVAAGK